MIRNDWNESACNPFDNKTKRDIINDGCEKKYILTVAERPYIRNVRGPLTDSPFVDVDEMRTPIDMLRFTIKEYLRVEDGFVDTEQFDSINYQNYVPEGIFRNNFYYTVECVAENASGTSPISNKYPVNLIKYPRDRQWQKIRCGGVIICDLPILCGI